MRTGSKVLWYWVRQSKLLSRGFIGKINLAVNASIFSMDKYTDGDGHTTYLRFHKVVPIAAFDIEKKKSLVCTANRFIQFKTYLIGEEDLRFYTDTLRNPPAPDSILFKYRVLKEDRTLNQLRLVVEKLSGPVSLSRRTKNWAVVRSLFAPGFTGNYFFNYPRGGGFGARVFGAKFIYLGSRTVNKQFNTDRYHLNMTGPNGNEDYSYTDYFLGRNEFEGLGSQQIMVRDGAFKIRTDLLADKIGKTDDWLIALNFASSLPHFIDPLSVLPKEVPLRLKLFADIGTYAEPWKKNSTADRFLFDAGLQCRPFKETVNFYFPFIYSKPFKDYIQSPPSPKRAGYLKLCPSPSISLISVFTNLTANTSSEMARIITYTIPDKG